MCVLEQIEGVTGMPFQIGEVGLDGLPIAVVTGLFGFEPALLTHEQIPRDDVGVVGVE